MIHIFPLIKFKWKILINSEKKWNSVEEEFRKKQKEKLENNVCDNSQWHVY